MKEYRKPDPWLVNNKTLLSLSALVVAAAGILVLWAGDGFMDKVGLIILGLDLLSWAHLYGKCHAKISDFVEYVEARAELDGSEAWLESVKEGFLDLWAIRDLEEMDL